MASFTREQLEEMTSRELKEMCAYELDMPGYSKKTKDVVIDAILAKYGKKTAALKVAAAKSPISKASGPMSGVEFQAQSVLTKPDAPFGSKTTTTIHVSCGASSGNFPVAGRTVGQVGDFLREVLNVDKLSTGLVNGKEVSPDYVLKSGDSLEYLKPAGRKGC
jgi:hypothetical protein